MLNRILKATLIGFLMISLFSSVGIVPGEVAETDLRAQPAPPAGRSSAGPAEVGSAVPLLFQPNQGQADARARFIVRAGGQTAYLTDSGIVFDSIFVEKELPNWRAAGSARPDEKNGKRLVWSLDFEGADPNPRISGEAPAGAKFHYLIGNDSSKWITDVPSYQAVVYHDLYRGIDLKLYGNQGRLEYDLIVRPGADPEEISLLCRGVGKLAVRDGELVASTEVGEIRQTRPFIYQEGSGDREEVDGGFRLLADNRYTFETGDFDRSRPLVIDPALVTLAYSTFLGGAGNDQARDIDEWGGMLYVVGDTYSSDFPVTTGAYDTTYNSRDAFVAKIDPSQSGASSLVWCTFLGGSNSEEGNGINASSGGPYVCGTTYSDDFPLVNNGSLGRVGDSDGFAALLNASGNGLLFSVMFGTIGWNLARDIAVSGTSVWVCGVTAYGDSFYPGATWRSSYGHTEYPSYTDSFIIQLVDAVPVVLGQIVLLGGSYADEVQAIAATSMNVYVTGHTYSNDFVTTSGAYDTSHSGTPGSNYDVFTVKLDYAGGMTYSTFFGNSEDPDFGWGIDVSSTGKAFICGETNGDIPIVNGYDSSRTHGYNSSGFMARFSADGSSVDYSTYIETDDFGGVASAQDIRVGNNDDCWVTGSSWLELYGIDSKNYYQLMQGYDDAFVVRINTLSTGLDSLVFGTHLGSGRDGAGTGHEFGLGVVGELNHAYLTGYTNSPGFPTANAYQSVLDGGEDAFVAHLVEPLPAVTTNAATLVYSSSATLNGTLTSKSGASQMLVRFVWGGTLGGPYSNATSETTTTSVPHSYSASLSGLTPSTTYYYRARAYSNLYGEVLGAEQSFTTPATAVPTVTTAGPSNITGTTAQSGGNVTNSGSDPILERGVCWNTGGTPTTTDTHTHDGAGTGTFTSNITGLSPNTTYWVRAYATNIVGTSYGNQVSFTTDNYPTVSTTSVTSITGSTASSGGNVTVDGGDPVTARGVCWNTTGSPTTANSNTLDGSGTGTFTSSLTGLSPNTTYYVRAYATNGVGTAYGNQVSFTTDNYPTVTTAAVTNITGSTATGGGNVTSDGGALVYERGVCWNTSGNPTTAGAHTDETGGTGSYDSIMTGLTPGTTYYVRAYATNSVGTSYGGQETFTTDTAPTVTTAAVTNITGTGATSGGNVTSDGGEAVTSRGVCWNTTGSPTTSDSGTTNGSGTGSFTSTLTSLSPGTTYYVRAYAINSVGTSYGGQETFMTDTAPSVTTAAVTNVTSSSADSGGNVTSDGGDPVTARGVCWNTTGTPTTADSTTSDGTGTGAFTSSLTGLTPGATYYVRAYAMNSTVGTGYGGQESFTTLPESPVAQPASSVGAYSFQANWSAAAGASGYRLDVALDGAFASILPAYNNRDVGNVTAYSVTGLNPATPYYYRLRAYNAGGTSASSNVIGVTTLAIHTVTFSAGSGGTLSGNTYQTVVHGSACTPVTALPSTGFRFIDWSGPGGFWSTANPLTLTDVQSDMNITAKFANLAPTIRIVNPASGANVWGSILIQAEASDDSGIQNVSFFVDGAPVQSASPVGTSSEAAASLYSVSWNTLVYANGPHVIKATAVDAAGATSTDQITVNVRNVMITLAGRRLEDRAWIIRREFARLNLTVVNDGNAPAARYLILRRVGSGAEEQIASINASELQNGTYEYDDATLPSSGACTYRVLAVTAGDLIIGLSNQVTL